MANIAYGKISTLTGAGTYTVDAINATTAAVVIENEAFTGKLIFNAIDTATNALTITLPNGTVELKGEVKSGKLTVKTSMNTFVVNGVKINSTSIEVVGGNVLINKGSEIVGAITIPAANTTTTKVEINEAKTGKITLENTTAPLAINVGGNSIVVIENKSAKANTINVKDNSNTVITNEATATIAVAVSGNSNTTITNSGTSTLSVDGSITIATGGTLVIASGATLSTEDEAKITKTGTFTDNRQA